MTYDPNVGALIAELTRLQTNPDMDPLTQELVPLRRVLGMRIAGEFYGINIDYVSEILKLTPVTWVPGAPAHVLGVTSLRGQIIPLINMRRFSNSRAVMRTRGPAAAAPPGRASSSCIWLSRWQGCWSTRSPRSMICRHP